MLNEPTMEKLRTLHLVAMATAWTAQREDPKSTELDFDTRFALLVDAEHLARDNKRLQRSLRDAKLRLPNACLEDFEVSPKREVDRAQLRTLGTCQWIAARHEPNPCRKLARPPRRPDNGRRHTRPPRPQRPPYPLERPVPKEARELKPHSARSPRERRFAPTPITMPI